ncbi:MAG TPA: L-threonylcarbamoyladenylate synthase [Candidatus Aminicenantes bacterium]|mgnify:CR=1 FL=1|nr:L-threonylcarbamoyladenylate synthase [Candidatus Aminicenantes bacterium]
MAIEVQQIDPEYPQTRLIRHAKEVLERGGIVIYPTDTIYGLGADIRSRPALERILKIKKASNQKLLSFILPDFSDIADWAHMPTSAYRLMKRVVPGKYTFVLPASKMVPDTLLQKRSTVGIRIPDAPVALRLAAELGRPLLSTSVPLGGDGFYTDPGEMAKQFALDVDLILDAGILANVPSTIIDFTSGSPVILRHGAGDTSLFEGA